MRRAALVLTVPLFALSACSGQEATPAERTGLEKKLTSENSPLGMPLQEKQAACVAEIYLTADFSDEARDAILAGEPVAPRTAGDQKSLDEITSKIADECLS